MRPAELRCTFLQAGTLEKWLDRLGAATECSLLLELNAGRNKGASELARRAAWRVARTVSQRRLPMGSPPEAGNR